MSVTTLGPRIKKLREQEKYSQLDLAKLLNISNSTLSQYENGAREPGYEVLRAIATFFGVTTDYLMGLSDNPLLTERDEKDIAKRIEALAKDLEQQENLMMHGEILDEDTRELVKSSIATAVKLSKLKEKKNSHQRINSQEE